jgi:hypothetical protein
MCGRVVLASGAVLAAALLPLDGTDGPPIVVQLGRLLVVSAHHAFVNAFGTVMGEDPAADVERYAHAMDPSTFALLRNILDVDDDRRRKLADPYRGTARSRPRMTKPGLAKGRRPPLVAVATHARLRVVEARWREAFASADVVSEGAARAEPHASGALVWYGSTSLIVPLAASEEERVFYAAIAERDLHVRTRALRIAAREAAARACATGPLCLGRSVCEIRVSTDPRGVRIDVDVQAPLIEGSAPRSSART